MNRVIVHGFYGYGSLGNEEILTVLKKEVKRCGSMQISVITKE